MKPAEVLAALSNTARCPGYAFELYDAKLATQMHAAVQKLVADNARLRRQLRAKEQFIRAMIDRP